MKTIELTATAREALGTTAAKQLRAQALLPGVLYGAGQHLHFYVPTVQLKPLVYTGQAHFVALKLAGKTYSCILKEVQMHPVSEMLLHVDLLEISDEKPITMQVPLRLVGTAPGVMAGGMLAQKVRKVLVRAAKKEMPDHVKLDVSKLELGQSARVRDITAEKGVTILDLGGIPAATVQIPRALRSKAAQKGAEATA